MCIYHNPSRDPKGRSEHDIGGFPPDSRQLNKLIHVLRDFAIVLFHQLRATGLDILGLIAEKARTLDGCFQLLDR